MLMQSTSSRYKAVAKKVQLEERWDARKIVTRKSVTKKYHVESLKEGREI